MYFGNNVFINFSFMLRQSHADGMLKSWWVLSSANIKCSTKFAVLEMLFLRDMGILETTQYHFVLKKRDFNNTEPEVRGL